MKEISRDNIEDIHRALIDAMNRVYREFGLESKGSKITYSNTGFKMTSEAALKGCPSRKESRAAMTVGFGYDGIDIEAGSMVCLHPDIRSKYRDGSIGRGWVGEVVGNKRTTTQVKIHGAIWVFKTEHLTKAQTDQMGQAPKTA